MVYVDALLNHGWRLGPSCHLFADNETELHIFARKIGMRRAWFQNKRTPHYDLTKKRRAVAVSLGAQELDRKATVAKWKEIRKLKSP